MLTALDELLFGNELPGSLLNAGDLTLVSQLAEADTADTVLTHVCVRTTTDLASGVFSGGELLRLLLLQNHSLLCHLVSPLTLRTERPSC